MHVRSDEVANRARHKSQPGASECFVGGWSRSHVMWELTHGMGVPHRHEWFLMMVATNAEVMKVGTTGVD